MQLLTSSRRRRAPWWSRPGLWTALLVLLCALLWVLMVAGAWYLLVVVA